MFRCINDLGAKTKPSIMRNVLILVLVLVSFKSNSQNILDFFLIVPDSVSVFGRSDRGQMIENYKNELNEFYYRDNFKYSFDVVDIKNGYLRVSGAFEGIWEICYWNKSEGKKLVGISDISCGPVCGSRITFYDHFEGELVALSNDSVLPPISHHDYYDIPKIQENNSLEDFDKLKKEFRVAWTYRLPQAGLNMIVEFDQIDEIDSRKYKMFYKGNTDKLELHWSNGHFTKGGYVK